MAQIVNDAAAPVQPKPADTTPEKKDADVVVDPRAGLDRAGVMELLNRTRKSIYDHTKLDILYRRHQAIKEIQCLSKTSIVKHICAHKAFWSTLHDRMKTYDGLDTSHPLFDNSGTIQFAKNVNGYGFYAVPISDRRKPEFGDDEFDPDTEYSVVSSLMQIADPFWGTCMTREVCEQIVEDLEEYIALGIYPTVGIPKSYAEQMVDAEKYETVIYKQNVGTIIDIKMETITSDTNEEQCRLYAIVMWSPKYTSEYSASMYGTFSGTLTMVSVNPLTNSWSPINDVSNIMARGNPIFEYRPNTMVLQTIIDNYELREMIDSAMTSGQIMFGFVDHLIARMKDMNDDLKEATEKLNAMDAPGPKLILKDNVTPVVQSDTSAKDDSPASYEEQSEVPTEDASEIDAVGRRMRLYDSEADDGDVEPIYNAFRVGEDDYD